jgi:hypothetical protein
MINTQTDELLGLSQAAAACPSIDGKRPHCSTLWRWMRKGCRGVKLEHVLVGRRVCTSRSALEVFFRDLAAAPLPTTSSAPQSPRGRTPRQRERDIAAARATLAGHGFKVEGVAQ